MAEMLEILVSGYDSSLSSSASSIIADMNRTEHYCQGAPQQTSNGTDASARLVELLARKIDKKNKYSRTIDNIVSTKVRNNSRCQGADQQSGNYMYRIIEFAQVITDVILDVEEAEAKARFNAYWEEHSEDRERLWNEREELEAKVQEIENRAYQINANEELKPLQDQMKQLQQKQETVPMDAVEAVEKSIRDKREERDNTGFFQFRRRKEIQAEIEDLEADKYKAKQDVECKKQEYQKQIDALAAQIKRINGDVAMKRNVVLAESEPHKYKIEQIEYELNRPR